MKNAEKVYVIAIADDSEYYIPDAEHIERNDTLMLVEDDNAAAKAAEQDGINLVYGMEYVPDGVYLETPANRAAIQRGLDRYPEYKNVVTDGHRSAESEPCQGLNLHFGKG